MESTSPAVNPTPCKLQHGYSSASGDAGRRRRDSRRASSAPASSAAMDAIRLSVIVRLARAPACDVEQHAGDESDGGSAQQSSVHVLILKGTSVGEQINL